MSREKLTEACNLYVWSILIIALRVIIRNQKNN